MRTITVTDTSTRASGRHAAVDRCDDATFVRFDDDAAHRRAVDHAVRSLGLTADPMVVWDAEHHLQGHLDVSGRHLVLIAPRTGDRAPRLLAEDEWDAVRRGVA